GERRLGGGAGQRGGSGGGGGCRGQRRGPGIRGSWWGRGEGRSRHGPATVSGEHRPVPLDGATVHVTRMGRWDGRADPRVRRPIRGGRFKTLSRKRSEAVRRVRIATVIMMPLAAVLPPAAAQEPRTLEPL